MPAISTHSVAFATDTDGLGHIVGISAQCTAPTVTDGAGEQHRRPPLHLHIAAHRRYGSRQLSHGLTPSTACFEASMPSLPPMHRPSRSEHDAEIRLVVVVVRIHASNVGGIVDLLQHAKSGCTACEFRTPRQQMFTMSACSLLSRFCCVALRKDANAVLPCALSPPLQAKSSARPSHL